MAAPFRVDTTTIGLSRFLEAVGPVPDYNLLSVPALEPGHMMLRSPWGES